MLLDTDSNWGQPLLTSLINAAPCLAIDLPGCGLSAFEPKTPKAYRTEALAELIAETIRQHIDIENGQRAILIGHSMGCSLATLIASSTSPISHTIDVAGFVALCPRAEPPRLDAATSLALNYMPLSIFDLYRAYDRRGGVDSPSVARYTGENADAETKRLQLRFNEQSKSDVFFAMAAGLVPQQVDGKNEGGLPGKSVWSGLKVPTFLIAGESDHICPPAYVELIAKWLGHRTEATSVPADGTVLPTAAGEAPLGGYATQGIDSPSDQDVTVENKRPQEILSETRQPNGIPKASTDKKPAFVLKTTVFPSPASHALLYSASTVRVLSGLLQSFMAVHVDHRLSLGWQLQHLTTEGKWDVKNLAKWQAVDPVSEPIAGVFRAMKTLREVDETHTPKVFVEKWGPQSGIDQPIRMVIDISHESPVYDPKGLECGGIEYHKFPTVSKLPPTVDEVRSFISLVDTLREQVAREESTKHPVVATHCHYGEFVCVEALRTFADIYSGFNRTGFFLVSYMVEQLGYRLQDALEEFAEKRAPGIRHEHFVNELFVRYSVGLQRRPTIC